MPQNKFETLARAGYAARGIVYLILDIIALTSAFWGGREGQDTSGALSELMGWPFGRVLVGFVAVGLFGYVLWKLAQGFLNADNAEDSPKGLLSRAGHLVSAATNLFLLLTAAKLSWTGGAASGGDGEETASAWLIQQPFGIFLLWVVAIAVIAAGIVQIWYGASGQFKKRLRLPPVNSRWLTFICQFGLVARGVVMVIVGGFVCYAALTVSPQQAGGTQEALDYVRTLPFGAWLFGCVALGLVAFGAYGLVQARYRSIEAPSMPHLA